jgi:FtsP/CotA-like multicopper oxidase with cupredoxin domain
LTSAEPAGREFRRRLVRIGVPVLASLLVLTPVAWLWATSLMPARYSVMEMGRIEYGGAPPGGAHDHDQHDRHDHGRSVTSFVVDEDRRPDVVVDLVARQQQIRIGGRSMPGFTLNGQTPGPLITAVEGDLIEVRLHNASVSAGVTLHWHGIDVANAMDGVAGVTQDAVGVGGDFSYRFIADHAGSYWYHSHQVSNAQVAGGLFGPLVIKPAKSSTERDVLAVAHVYGGIRTINGKPGDLRIEAGPGDRLRLRVINTDNGPVQVWSNSPYRLLAVDGRELHGPQLITGRSVGVGAGARVDLGIEVPADGPPVRVQVGSSTAVVIGAGTAPPMARPNDAVDLISYGTPGRLSFDPARADRRFDYLIDRRPGFVRGRPGLYWSINGRLYPDVPMYVVREGDVVVMTIKNRSGEVHPMHLHGHHAVVLSRNGVSSAGTPWWVDSLDVGIDETYVIAFVADNPGIWMDHCHNLKHAADGMIAHLMYEGVTTPFMIGGTAANQPE